VAAVRSPGCLPALRQAMFGVGGRQLLSGEEKRAEGLQMDKDVAKALLTLGKSIDDVIVKMFAEVEKIDDEKLKARLNRAVGDLMGFVARDLIFPIENIYPDMRTDI
jgi:hypothetical protein